MRRIRLTLALVAALALPLSGWLGAEATPEARKWLEKVASLGDGGVSYDYSGAFKMTQMGQTMDMAMDGRVVQADTTHQRMDMTMTMSGVPGMPEGMEMKMLTVSDGEMMWIEMSHPMMGKQVMKVSLEKAKSLGESGNQLLGGGVQSDPMTQIREMAEAFDIDVESVVDGKVTLRADFTPATVAKVKQSLPGGGEGLTSLKLVFDEKTGYPQEMSFAGDGPEMTFRFSNVEKKEADPALFRYTPPEGARVMDLEAMAAGAGAR